MNAASLLQKAALEGVRVRLESENRIKAYGPRDALARWTPTLREHKPDLIEALSVESSEPLRPSRPPNKKGGGVNQDRQPQNLGGLNNFGGLNPVMFTASPAEPTSVASIENLRARVERLLDRMAADNGLRRDWHTRAVKGWREGWLELRSAMTGETTIIYLSNRRARS